MSTPSIAVIGGVAVLLFGGGVLVGRKTIAPPIPVQVAHGQTQIRETEQAHIDTIYMRTDRWLTKTLDHFDTVQAHDTILKHLTDTVMVKEYVSACDSLRSACQSFKDSSSVLRVADHNLIAAQATELQAWRQSQPSKFRQIVTYTAVAVAGYSLGKSGIQLPFLH